MKTKEIIKAEKNLSFYVGRLEHLKKIFEENKNDLIINEKMFEVVNKKGDIKEKEKKNFDKKYILKNGNVFRKSDNVLILWFNQSNIFYQKDKIQYYCLLKNEKIEISKDAWILLNFWKKNNF